MDAISFVLGIKTNQLRSAQLQELIYNDGIQDECYVSCVLDTDEGDLTFKRIVQGNSSVYKINDKTTTFANYLKVLGDQDILVKARNFLISSQSPKDLTRLIEQISGSLEYKQEYEQLKQEMQKSLENTNLNYNKKKNINIQLKQYKEQEREMKKYQNLISKKQDQIVLLHLWKLYHLEQRLKQNSTALEKELESKEKLEGQLTNTKRKELTQQQAKYQKQVLLYEKKINTANQELKQLSMVNLIQEQKHLSSLVAKSKQSLSDLLSNQKTKTQDLAQLKKDLDNIAKKMDELNQDDIQLNPEQLAVYQQKKQEIESNLALEYLKVKNIKTRLKTLKETDKPIDFTVLTDEKRLLEKNLAKVSKESKQQEKSELESERKMLAQKEIQIHEKLEVVQNKLLQAKQEEKSTRHKKKLKEAIDSLRTLFPGFKGKIIDLCKPNQRKYDQAVSVIMGKQMDSVVVDTEKTAIECINYLKEQRLEKLTFIPLDTISTKPIHDKYRNYNGAKLAIDVLQYLPVYEKAIKYVVSNTMISEDLSVAKHLAFDKSVKVVLLEGTVFHKTGMITGGSGDASSSKRWQEKEVEELLAKKQQYMDDLLDIQTRKRKLQDEDSFDTEGLLRKIESFQEEALILTSKISDKTKELEELQKKQEEYERDQEIKKKTIIDLQNEMHEIDDHIKAQEIMVFKEFCQDTGIEDIRAYHQIYSDSLQKSVETRLEYQTAKIKLENMILFDEKRLQDLDHRIKHTQETAASLESRLQKVEGDISKFEQKINGIREKIDGFTTDLQAAKNGLNSIVSEMEAFKQKNSEIETEIQATNKSISKREAQLELLKAEKIAILRSCKLQEVDIPLVDSSLKNLALAEFNPAFDADVDMQEITVDYAELSNEFKKDGSEQFLEQIEQNLKDIQDEIERLAPSIRTSERMDEINHKLKETNLEFEEARNEAKEAKEKFEEIKKQRYTLFHRCYTHIADTIDDIYKELTKSANVPVGGTAYLSLEDSDEPYNDGIKYHAMPPMKRFREMELLSGGEKTIVSLALLFAIHSYQPSPFFILDEVDAALDNTNVQKVLNYIKKQKGPSFQFIVISLKSGFYQDSDSLVGIYKDIGEGTSKTMTLDLTKYEN
ncbi:Structural maintenance of chromosomes protein 1 [Boothiomyces macroporosus]|uniref:Structural maintenance of chromosomes protein 1 n=1 Tax=Boothiomyces macroporosus TaxID=261099 RepID=A0AAD5UMS8_9FUNG|nr:Structural maintenance of chromosomes protein 1 [Boothiomyces macroporosus]